MSRLCCYRDLLLIALLGVVFTAMPYLLFINSLQSLKVRQASSIISLEVAYGAIFAAVLLDEIPSLRTVLGGLVILGVALYLTLEVNRHE